jgi:hypothetical protein
MQAIRSGTHRGLSGTGTCPAPATASGHVPAPRGHVQPWPPWADMRAAQGTCPALAFPNGHAPRPRGHVQSPPPGTGKFLGCRGHVQPWHPRVDIWASCPVAEAGIGHVRGNSWACNGLTAGLTGRCWTAPWAEGGRVAGWRLGLARMDMSCGSRAGRWTCSMKAGGPDMLPGCKGHVQPEHSGVDISASCPVAEAWAHHVREKPAPGVARGAIPWSAGGRVLPWHSRVDIRASCPVGEVCGRTCPASRACPAADTA